MWKSRNFPDVQFLELAKVSLLYWNSVIRDNLDLLKKWLFCLHWERREEWPSPERSHTILLSSSVSFWLHAEWQEVMSGLTRDYEEALEVGQWCIWEQHLIILYELNALKSLFFQWCTSSFQSNTIFVITNKTRHSKQPSVRTKRRPVERKCFSCEHKCVFGAVTSQTSKALEEMQTSAK